MTMRRVSRAKWLVLAGVFAGALASFAAIADAATETVLYSFQNNGKDGLLPGASLIDVNGTLYGTTGAGGSGRCENGCGTVFSVNVTTGAETVLHSFASAGIEQTSPGPGALVDAAGTLFGTTQTGGHRDGGMIYTFDPNSGAFKKQYYFCNLYYCSDGNDPNSGLVDFKGTLYGTTYEGGTYNSGVVFTFDPKTRSEAVLHAFGGEGDGSDPLAGLLNVKGVLYGTTGDGGSGSYCDSYGYYYCGTIFSLDPVTGAESVIYSFCSQAYCADGQLPRSNLIKLNGALYGTTQEGGAFNTGTAFSINLSKGTEKVLHSFGVSPDGVYPSGLLVDVNGVLYGTTTEGGGGSCGCGTVFSIDPKTGTESVVYSFCSQVGCADGDEPIGGLLNVNGTLYGVTQYGGNGTCSYVNVPSGCGTVFSITP